MTNTMPRSMRRRHYQRGRIGRVWERVAHAHQTTPATVKQWVHGQAANHVDRMASVLRIMEEEGCHLQAETLRLRLAPTCAPQSYAEAQHRERLADFQEDLLQAELQHDPTPENYAEWKRSALQHMGETRQAILIGDRRFGS